MNEKGEAIADAHHKHHHTEKNPFIYEAQKCPKIVDQDGAPKGMLFNHVSKSGGTLVKELLISAFGIDISEEEVTLLDSNVEGDVHFDADDEKIGPKGSLVFQDDNNYGMKASKHDAGHFFVIGAVRKPCDYLVSYWAFGSALNAEDPDRDADSNNLRIWGRDPPYDNHDDIKRFQTWLGDISAARDLGMSFEEGTNLESVGILDRYESPSIVHCWVQTDRLVDDMKKCMQQYQECGGYIMEDGLTDERVAQAVTRAAGTARSDVAECSTFFDRESTSKVLKKVMESEQSLMDAFEMGTCCASKTANDREAWSKAYVRIPPVAKHTQGVSGQ